ncbi:MAG: alkaline phosphatase PhoX, partial [Ilumatobacteraceae bacterium]
MADIEMTQVSVAGSWGRRRFIRGVALASGAAIVGGTALRSVLAAAAAVPGVGPYGPLGTADANGIMLPAGFSSRLLAVTGRPVTGSAHVWHAAPDGGACFPSPDGGWVYVSNAELNNFAGGAAALRFDASGTLVGAHTILSGTSRNCAGGRTVANTWLSCEEVGSNSKVYECDPLVPGQGVQRPALGSFNHEAAVEDPVSRVIYLTEDDPAGRLYRFVPTVPGNFTVGQLFAANVTGGRLAWVPTTSTAPDRQTTTTVFNGGEGLWIEGRTMYVTTKGDLRVWEVQLDAQTISVLYDGNTTPGAALNAVDNCTVHAPSGDVYVCEDGGNMEVCLIATASGTADREVAAFLRIVGHDSSEWCGVAFSPDHRRMYLSSQRGGADGLGRTYEITGPFRTAVAQPTVVTDTLVAAGSIWRYHDEGLDLGSAWRAAGYDASAWKQGVGPLGYGDPVATVINGGALATKPITAYFRTSFTGSSSHTNLSLRLRRDDGAVVYLNGVEVARSNMPAGIITASTLASSSINDGAETTIHVIPVSASLVTGTNVLAVEVHQFQTASSDLTFDLSF